MTLEKDFVIRTMGRDDLELAVDWAADEGWNPGIKDADCFYNSDPQGFFIGELAGQPVGCISAVTYGEAFGFLGFYIVKPEYRRQGYGIRLWKKAMSHMGDRVVGLDGVPAQQNNYIKSGFHTAYRNLRFEGVGNGCGRKSKELVDLAALPLTGLLSYDKPLFPAARRAFLEKWIKPGSGAALGYVGNARLEGYGVIRACRYGYKIGPLFADTEPIAGTLLEGLMGNIEAGAPVFLDVPHINAPAINLAESLAMRAVSETVRMYCGGPPSVDLERIYGVTSLELG